MNWEGMITPALVTTALAAVTGGAAKVWQLIQQGRLDCLERCAALTLDLRSTEKERDEARQELKTERLEHWKTALALASLQGKLERERAGSSRPPQR